MPKIICPALLLPRPYTQQHTTAINPVCYSALLVATDRFSYNRLRRCNQGTRRLPRNENVANRQKTGLGGRTKVVGVLAQCFRGEKERQRSGQSSRRQAEAFPRSSPRRGSIARPKNPSSPLRAAHCDDSAGATHIGHMGSERNTAARCACALQAAWYPHCIAYRLKEKRRFSLNVKRKH